MDGMPQSEGIRIAIVDDYEKVAETIAAYVRRTGCTPVVFTNPLEFLDALKDTAFDIVITDISMPQMDGISLLKKVRKRAPDTAVIVVSAHAEKKDAIEALKQGAYDFFEKPVNKDHLEASIKRTVQYQAAIRDRGRLSEQLSYVSQREAERWGLPAFVGKSQALKKVVADIRSVQSVDRTTVLIVGESGAGKELVARAIHAGSKRKDRPFIPLNCSAIPDNLAESILFGHVRGSFTGATADKKGAFEVADGGTLFLDEIGDMLPVIQAKLLRVLEDGIVDPVGATRWRKVDVRIIAATNADLETRIQSGSFRTDLYHRLSAFTVSLPALRDRQGDIPLLAEHFVKSLSSEMGLPVPQVSAEVLSALESYSFPGNVRELRNVIEQALIRSRGKELTVSHLSLNSHVLSPAPRPQPVGGDVAGPPDAMPLDLAEMEKMTIMRAMKEADGNVSAAARLMGISRNKLYRML